MSESAEGENWPQRCVTYGHFDGMELECGLTRRAGGQSETVENFPSRVGRVNGGEDAQAFFAAGTFEHVQGPHPLHQFSPGIVSPMSRGGDSWVRVHDSLAVVCASAGAAESVAEFLFESGEDVVAQPVALGVHVAEGGTEEYGARAPGR